MDPDLALSEDEGRDALKGGARLAVIVFTAGALTPPNRVFLQRLAAEPLVDLRAVVVDEFRRRPRPLYERIAKGIRKFGWQWLAYRLRLRVAESVHSQVRKLYDRFHELRPPAGGYDSFARETSVEVLHVSDIHSAESIDAIRIRAPDLGVILGGRILKDEVTQIPGLGTLNIHKRKVPEYRGGGAVGYWELLNGESDIGITIHYAIQQVDAGDVLSETTIPIDPCDTMESLAIKTDIRGAKLYLDTICRVARGERQGRKQNHEMGNTFQSAGVFREHQLENRLRQRQHEAMPALRDREGWFPRVRVFIQYLLVLPWLIRTRNHLVSDGRAPVWLIYYHLVGNRPLNGLCIPLEMFAQQIETIQRYYEIVSLDESLRLAREGSDRICVAITFDDGYRDNDWAIEYLQFYSIPVTFFVSVGHINDGSRFAHDLDKGFEDAWPITPKECCELEKSGLVIGSHAVYHENFAKLDGPVAQEVLARGRRELEEMIGTEVPHFSFPFGLRGRHITRETYELAKECFDSVSSAYGGYNFPPQDPSHLHRIPNPLDLLELYTMIDGYVGLRRVTQGDAWTVRTHGLPPYLD